LVGKSGRMNLEEEEEEEEEEVRLYQKQ